jgi:hypothetical protein
MFTGRARPEITEMLALAVALNISLKVVGTIGRGEIASLSPSPQCTDPLI